MVIPWIPVVIRVASLGLGLIGVKRFGDGISDMELAQWIVDRAEERHDQAVEHLEGCRKSGATRTADYGALQRRVLEGTVARFVEFMNRIGRSAISGHVDSVVGIDVATTETERIQIDAHRYESVTKVAIAAAATNLAVKNAITGLVGVFGHASTGTAISTLHGAALNSARLAWLGGGALRTGAGGMALGSVVLGGISLGATVVITGFVVAGHGERAVTNAICYESKLDKKRAEMEGIEAFLAGVEGRIGELDPLLRDLESRANALLDQLACQEFDPADDAQLRRFQAAVRLVTGIAELLRTPVLTEDGNLNQASVAIQTEVVGRTESTDD